MANVIHKEGIHEDTQEKNQVTKEIKEIKDKMDKMLKMVNEKLPPAARENKILKDLIKTYSNVFSIEQDALQVTPYFICTMKQIDDAVVYRKPYPIPVSYHERVRAQLINLEKQGIICPIMHL